MSKSIYNDPKVIDNLIITMIKIYPLSLSYAFLRASQLTGRSKSYCQNRYYNIIRHEVTVFSIKTELVEIKNTKRFSKKALEEMESREQELILQDQLNHEND